MLSKTGYITYLKHPAWLWLRKYDPDFLQPPDENSQAIIDEGREFKKLAEQIFPEAIRLDRSKKATLSKKQAMLQQETDELITVILPTINNDK